MNTDTSLSSRPTRQSIRQLAGNTYFERGEDYYERGMVDDIAEYQGTIRAKIEGSYRDSYRVSLSWNGKRMEYDCSCPLGEEGAFCKHCVAAALAWLDDKPVKDGREADDPIVSLDDIKAYLLEQSTDVLVDYLMPQLLEDSQLRQRLMIKALRAKSSGLNVSQLKKSLDRSMTLTRYLDWDEADSYIADVETSVETIRDTLNEGYFKEAMELSDHALRLLDEAIEHMHDDNGESESLIADLEAIHMEACQVAARLNQLNRHELADNLLAWNLESDWHIFSEPIEKYSTILGETGVAYFRQTVETEWNALPALKPGQSSSSHHSRLEPLLISLYRYAGETDNIVTVYQKDLSSAYRFLKIAQAYLQAGLTEKAIQWAEEGLRVFSENPERRLLQLLMEMYHATGNREKAIHHAWMAYQEHPHSGTYQTLKRYAASPDDWEDSWPVIRVKALALLREKIAENHQKKKSHYSYTSQKWQPNQTELVEILLWENDVQSAWEEANQGWISGRLWLTLADQRATTHPADAVKIYKDQVEPTIAIKKNDAYLQAISYLVKIKALMAQIGEKKAFERYMNELRSTHKAKRNFIQYLKEQRL